MSRFKVMEIEKSISKGNRKEIFKRLKQEQRKFVTSLIREEKPEVLLTSQRGKERKCVLNTCYTLNALLALFIYLVSHNPHKNTKICNAILTFSIQANYFSEKLNNVPAAIKQVDYEINSNSD